VRGEGYSKDSKASHDAFTPLLSSSALKVDGSHLLHIDSAKTKMDTFFANAMDSVKHLRNPCTDILNRIEIKVHVTDLSHPASYQTCLGDSFIGVYNTLLAAETYDAEEYLSLLLIPILALQGQCEDVWKLAPNHMIDFVGVLNEIRSQGYPFWSGVVSYANPYHVAPISQLQNGRPIFSPFSTALTNIRETDNHLMESFHLLLSNLTDALKNGSELCTAMQSMKVIVSNLSTLLNDPFTQLCQSEVNKLSTLPEEIAPRCCTQCFFLFRGKASKSQFEEHICSLPVVQRDYAVHTMTLTDKRYTNFLAQRMTTMTDDQKNVVIGGLEIQKPFAIWAPAGYGKSYTMITLIHALILKYGFEGVIIASMIKLASLQLSIEARTLHSLFKWTTDNKDLYKLMNFEDTAIIRNKVKAHITKSFSPADIEMWCKARVLIVEECGAMSEHMLEFINIFCQEIRNTGVNQNTPIVHTLFGGLLLKITGDSAQGGNYPLKAEMKESLKKSGHKIFQNGERYYFESSLFRDNFDIGYIFDSGHRFKKNVALMDLLHKLRLGIPTFTINDLYMLNNMLGKCTTEITNVLRAVNLLAAWQYFRLNYSFKAYNQFPIDQITERLGYSSAIISRYRTLFGPDGCKLFHDETKSKRFTHQNDNQDFISKLVQLCELTLNMFSKFSEEYTLLCNTKLQQKAYAALVEYYNGNGSQVFTYEAEDLFYYVDDEDVEHLIDSINIKYQPLCQDILDAIANSKCEKVIKVKLNDIVIITDNKMGLSIGNNMRAKILRINPENKEILIQPIDPSNSQSTREVPSVLIKPVMRSFNLTIDPRKHPYMFTGTSFRDEKAMKAITFKRMQFPIANGSVSTIPSIKGLTFVGKVCIDNTLGLSSCNCYIGCSRSDSLANIHFPFTLILEECKSDDAPTSSIKTIETYYCTSEKVESTNVFSASRVYKKPSLYDSNS